MSPDPNLLDPERLDRYLTGANTPDERAKIDAMLAERPELHAFVEASRISVDSDGLWTRFTNSSHYSATSEVRRSPRGAASTRRSIWSLPKRWAYTSSLLLAAAAIFAVALQTRSHTTVETGEYVTSRAERKAITLPDGSHALLGPETRLSFSVDRDGKSDITVQGQAYFTVVHDHQRPFAVRTGTVVTKVLGTAFDVRHYPGDDAVQVSVVSGKVSSGTPTGERILTPGMIASFQDSVVRMTMDSTVQSGPSWAAGRLVFTEVPVASVLRTLQRWYDYEFRLVDTALATKQVTARFTVDDPARTLIALQALLDVNVTRQGRIIILRPRTPNTRTAIPTTKSHVETVSRPLELGK